jgi:GNAT superfamily N-acetyltransferase
MTDNFDGYSARPMKFDGTRSNGKLLFRRMEPTCSIRIEPATEADIPQILAFIRGLAEYEKLAHQCVATEESLRQTLFGPRRYADVLIARRSDLPVGFALFFHNYSTFLAKPGIYLEDIFVLPEHRGAGVGKALLRRVAQIALERNCGRFEWSVLDWNEPSIEFYKRIGATVLPDWRICRMTEQQIAQLAE